MRIPLLAAALLLALGGAVSFAHGNKVHVRGTVEKIGADSIQVKTPEGKTVEVRLTASTVYLLHVAQKPGQASDGNEDKPATLTDLVVGDLVVIHATPKDGHLDATEIKFSVPAKPKS
jgi:Domain of unknown function (DUF5666)